MVITDIEKKVIKEQLNLYADNKQDIKDANDRNKDIVETVAQQIRVDKGVVRKAFAEMIKEMEDKKRDLDEVQELLETIKS